MRAAAALVGAAGLQAGPAVACSARTGAGLAALPDAVGRAGAAAPPRADDGFAYLPVDRAFSMPGHGTVVTGTLRAAGWPPATRSRSFPPGWPSRARPAGARRRVAQAVPGQRVAVNLRDVEPGQVARGAALAHAGALPASAWLSVQLRSVADAPALATGATLLLLFGTEEVEARLRLLDCDDAGAGRGGLAQLQLRAPVAVPARERFILRGLSPARTVAGGARAGPGRPARQRRTRPACWPGWRRWPSRPGRIVAGELARGAPASPSPGWPRIAGLAPAQRRRACWRRTARAARRRGRMPARRWTRCWPGCPRLCSRMPDGVARGAGRAAARRRRAPCWTRRSPPARRRRADPRGRRLSA